MNIKGIVAVIGPVQQVGDNGFVKRDIVIEYAENPTYPELIKFELLKDKIALADELAEGMEVEVDFNLRGRPWTNREGQVSYFNSLVAWRISVLRSVPIEQPQYSPPADMNNDPDADDDLPF